MSEETRGTGREGSGGDVAAVLYELQALEASIRAEVDRLSDVRAPSSRRAEPTRFRDRPLWWWRYCLTIWAHSPPVTATHAGDVLRGFRLVLKEWDDPTLHEFLSRLPPSLPPVPVRRLRSA